MTSGRRLVAIRISAALAAAATTVPLTSGCGTRTDVPSAAIAEKSTEQTVSMIVDDPHATKSLAALADVSPVVVTGAVVESQSDLTVGTDDSLKYTLYKVRVNRAFKGEVGEYVNVLMSTSSDGKPLEVVGRSAPIAGENSVWMLRPVADEFALDAFVLASVGGLVSTRDGKVIPPKSGVHDTVAADQAVRAGTLQAVIALLRLAR